MKRFFNPLFTILILTGLFIWSCQSAKPAAETIHKAQAKPETINWPNLAGSMPPDSAIEQRIHKLLDSMTLEQKVGQMIQVDIRSFTYDDFKKYRFGSVLNGGGCWPQMNKAAEISHWTALADSIWQAVQDGASPAIPPIWGTDAVHGHNNVKNATLFPHNIGLGAAHSPGLMKKIGAATAKEVAATGIDWNFAPTLAVVRDKRWGRSYESYAQTPDILPDYATQYIQGLQGNFSDSNILATAKHYIGDGGTHKGDDQGDNQATESELLNIHAAGYIAAIKADVQTIMVSFSSWRGKKMHEHKYLITDVLKNKMGFNGFVISDWNGHGQVPGCSNASCPQAINAGIDMVMVPFKNDWEPFYNNLIEQVKNGEVPIERINEAVTRILRVKARTGILDKPKPSERTLAGKVEIVGAPEHRAVAREAVRKSLVLLKNKGNVLPLRRQSRILVAGKGADSIAIQCGGWSLTWMGTQTTNADFDKATSILKGIRNIGTHITFDPSGSSANHRKHDVAIVVIGETPYAEMAGDIEGGLTLEHAVRHPEDLQVLKTIRKSGVPIVTIFLSGRPMYVNRELNLSEAFVAAWLPGSEGQGVADVLFRNDKAEIQYDFSGHLTFAWPNAPCQTLSSMAAKNESPLFPIGFGLTYKSRNSLDLNLPEAQWESYGCNDIKLTELSAEGPLLIFDKQFPPNTSPWMGDPSNWAGKAGTADSSLPNLSIHYAPDKNQVANAARRLVFKGPAYYGIVGDERSLAGYMVHGYELVFDLKVITKPETALEAVILCNYPCHDKVDISPKLGSLPLDTWSEIRLPLKKFLGVDFQKVTAPFQLGAHGPSEIVVANIRWEKSTP